MVIEIHGRCVEVLARGLYAIYKLSVEGLG